MKRTLYIIATIGILLICIGSFMGVLNLHKEVQCNKQMIFENREVLDSIILMNKSAKIVLRVATVSDSLKIKILKENNQLLKTIVIKLN